MQRGRYPRILPAAPAGFAGPPPNPSEAGKEASKKRISSQPRPGACLDCRTRKTKCDGLRPACTNCSKRGHAACVYPERLVNGQKAIELVELLKSLPEDRSSALLKRLREKGDPGTVVSESQEAGSEADSPSKSDYYAEYKQHQSSLEGELMANNPRVFPVLPPIDHVVLAKSNLLRPWLPESAWGQFDSNEAEPHLTVASEYPDPQEQPVEYCDEQLQYLQVRFWTDIKISNDFVAKVISVYMKTDQPLLGLFDTNLFITDLVKHRTKHCSRFLFHAVMYLGCQMYSIFDASAIQYAGDFCRVAEMLWKREKDSYQSMAGAILLSISLMAHGKNHDVLTYASDAMKMGTRLGLFGAPAGQAANNTSQSSTGDATLEELSARSHAAWGVFNWNVMISMFHRQPGSETPASTPSVPIPGEARNETSGGGPAVDGEAGSGGEREGYEDEYYPLSEELIMRRAFPMLCNFWRLVHEARWIYYPVPESPPNSLRERLVEYAYRELLAWGETLPSLFLRREQCPHFVIVFHIWLHTAILDMWQPFINRDTEEIPQLKTFSARDATSDAAYTASVNQLKQLIVEYRSRHAASSYSILWHNGLIYLANAMLRCTDPEWHVYLHLCIYGYERLGRTFRISEIVAQGLLTMTMRDTNMTGREAYKIMETMRERGLIHVHPDLEDKIRATFMIDLNLALTNPEAARAETMANDFSDLATFQDLVDFNPAGL